MAGAGKRLAVGTSYRERINARYSSVNIGRGTPPTEADYRLWPQSCFRRIKGWLPVNKGARCFDVACGAGNVLFMLKESGYYGGR